MVRATAPRHFNNSFLGRPVDSNFNPIQGAGSLFPPTAIIARTPVNAMSHEFVEVRSQAEFAANAQGWNIASVNFGYESQRHHASHRAFQVRHVAQINSSFPMQPPPPGAAYYVATIEYGHSYEAVVSGDWNHFNARVALELGKFAGDVRAFAGQHNLNFRASGFGLRPVNGAAIFAHDMRAIQGHYSTDGPPVAIYVSYQPIGATGPQGGPPVQQPLTVTIRFDRAAVQKTGSWFSDRWNLSIACGHRGQQPVAKNVLVGQRVNAGEQIPLNYTETLPAMPGERISCVIQGQALDKGRNLGAPTPYEFPVPAGPKGWNFAHPGGTGKTKYVLHGVVSVEP